MCPLDVGGYSATIRRNYPPRSFLLGVLCQEMCLAAGHLIISSSYITKYTFLAIRKIHDNLITLL